MDAGTPPPGGGPDDAGKAITRLACPHCGHVIEFSGLRPLFCGFCGKALTGSSQETTVVPPTGPEAPTVTPYYAGPLPPPAQPQAIGGYRLLKRLGGGGMGTVYEAEDSCGRRVALKLIAGNQAGSDDTLERFRREGRLASAIAHPRCVFVLAADEDAGRPYIVMELMPGTTLADVLRERGPLPPAEAVAKTVDVIDGLREAHRLGVVHRDIKPSNCFVDTDGRVKIGDFGLSKSLVGDSRLTQTGAFLGTPLFASPEQVRSEPLGPQSDVYSLAATLYCLLTGQAPFEGGDAAATLARIAADPVPSMRTRRPELSPALDRVVLRGLERDWRRRWRDLDEFKEALAPFMPGRQDAASRGARFAAFTVDWTLIYIVELIWAVIALGTGLVPLEQNFDTARATAVQEILFGWTIWLLYFVPCERLLGGSPGKLLLRLRVCTSFGRDRPDWRRTLLRFVVFYALFHLDQFALLPWLRSLEGNLVESKAAAKNFAIAVHPLRAGGIVLLLCTMRRRNGWRGLHEFASGTSVFQLPEAARRLRHPVRPLGDDLSRVPDLPQRIGPFEVRGALRWDDSMRVLVGEDRGLGRSVLLWLRPAGTTPPGPQRRACARATRLRWLAAGEHDGWQWDAFPMPGGRPLAEHVAAAGPLRWPEARPALEGLTEELIAADREGTLPRRLSLGQVWVQPDCGALLLDMPLRDDAEPKDSVPFQQQALALLAQVATLALEGPEPRGRGHVNAVVPLHASQLLDRLVSSGKPYPPVQRFGVQTGLPPRAPRPSGKPYQSVEEFRGQLEATRGRRMAVTSDWRAAQLVVQSALLGIGLITMIAVTWLAGFPALVALRAGQFEGEPVVERYRVGMAGDLVAGAFSPEPFARAAAAYRAQVDAEEYDRLRRELEDEKDQLHTRLHRSDWLNHWVYRRVWEVLEKNPERFQTEGRTAAAGVTDPVPDFRDRARRWEKEQQPGQDAGVISLVTAGLILVLWPAIWIVGTFVFRGPVSYAVMGMALVRHDGRRAGRFRCAWRAVLVWSSVVVALGVAVVVELWPSPAGSGAGMASPWWVVEILRMAGTALLGIYAILAIRSPERGPHDRLAGTYLVPR